MNRFATIVIFLLTLYGCNPWVADGVRKRDLKRDIELVTDKGSIIFRLYDETPMHRNNFLKLVNQSFYDSILFHRVINNFLIQTGDPDSKNAPANAGLGDGELPYVIPAEINATYFHKRGAVNAARMGDLENPEQASSSTQFTFIQRKAMTDSMINVAEKRINYYLAYNKVVRNPENQNLVLKIRRLGASEVKNDSLSIFEARLNELAKKEMTSMASYRIPEEQRQIYRTVGGSPHLDQNYTVFGEVLKGMDVVDQIAGVETRKSDDRPVSDVRIKHIKLIRRKRY